ncbi:MULTISPECIES: hypothetical protein [Paenibacillus]|nr:MULTISPECIES: hypothetical protein [Paenibacillus]
MSKSKRSDQAIVSLLLGLASSLIIAFFVIRYIIQHVSFAP